MKILFINPSLRQGTDHIFLPVGLGYVVTYVKQYGYNFDILDIDLKELLKFHKKNKGIGTFTSVIPEGRFGVFRKDSSNLVTSFSEKKDNEKTEINAGFFVFENEIFNYLNTDDSCVLEEEPLSNLAKDKKLYSYPHKGFWKCMDTLKDKHDLEKLWAENPKWKIW